MFFIHCNPQFSGAKTTNKNDGRTAFCWNGWLTTSLAVPVSFP
jgi:hypothetical protein